MPRDIITTNWTQRELIDKTNFFVTQSLDFLMTEDNNYIVVQDTKENSWTQRLTIITNWN